ncbi:MAG: M20 family metallopeptidase, partial [Bacteroidota bacterium]
QLHQFPEIGYQEVETSQLICNKLEELGISYNAGIAKTGIVGEIDKGPGKCIALRADIDALPIQEETELEFASLNAGVMHACGHDVHTTMLLGAIMELQEKDFSGKVRFIFQPSEEGVYEDLEKKSGGQRIVEAGTLQGVDFALALHVHPLVDVGQITYAPGAALACASHFKIIVKGKAGHAGAAPHLAIDSILVASSLIQHLNTIVSRDIDPTKTGVVSVTMISGGTAPNIIADKVEISGTIRALELDEYNLIQKRVMEIIDGMSIAYGAKIDFEIELFYPSLLNHENLHIKIEEVAKSVFDKGVLKVDPIMGGEDFAFYSREVPSMFYFLGAKSSENEPYFLHHPKMIVNEDCIQYGVNFLTQATLKLLSFE